MDEMKLTNAQRAGVLVQALPYIQKYYGKIVVIKLAETPCSTRS